MGKGDSGKTTLSSMFVRHPAGRGLPVVAVDADINQHLGEALGVSADPPELGAHLVRIKEYLRGDSHRIVRSRAGWSTFALDRRRRRWTWRRVR